ncbi:MAG: hypothetical protein ACR2JB_30030 [Bryobacteraceae bacterium]
MSNYVSRRSALVGFIAGIASVSGVNANASPQLVYRRSDWNISAFDLLLKKPARAKQAYDIISIGEGKFLNNVKNSLNGLLFGFGIPPGEVQVLAALHGPANLLNYDDYVWQRYKIGEWLTVEDSQTGRAAVRNIFFPERCRKRPAICLRRS